MKPDPTMYYRPDIQGLRGLSILLVLLFHFKESLVPAGFFGVDVFFVVSGFIITSLLFKEHDGTGRIDLLRFWARRAKRLLPNATLVLLFVLLVGAFTLPSFKFEPLAQDVVAAALYVSNFHFASTSIDYFTSNRAPSPVLHYWSLSVEEQFYLVWPLLLLALHAVRGRRDFRSLVAPVLAALWLASFAFCVYIVYRSQPLAFFHTGARVWELASGAMLAVHSDRAARLLSRWRELACVAGILAIGGSVFLLGNSSLHPGFWTLIPVVGTLLVIAGGSHVDGHGMTRTTALLSARPMQWLGDRSYSIYLWHWPVIVLARTLLPDRSWMPWLAVAAALVLAELAFRFVENPLRHGRWLVDRALAQLLVSALLVVGVVLASAATGRIPNALAGRQGGDWAKRIGVASNDDGANNKAGCHLDSPYVDQPECLYGRPDAPRTAVLIGDSHAAHWFPALERASWIANWKFHAWSKSICPSAMIHGWNPRRHVPYGECDEWRNRMLKRILSSKERVLVFLTGSNDYSGYSIDSDGKVLSGASAQADYERGLRETTALLLKGGHHVAIIRDTPLADVKYKECILAQRGGEGCERPRERALNPNLMEKRVADSFPGVAYIDVADLMCGPKTCPVIIDGQIVYRDDSHMTATFAATLYEPILDVLRRFSR